MARIKINPDGLKQNRDAISQKITELQAFNSRLDALLSNIGDSWDGDASQQYIATMTYQKTKAQEMVSVLQELRNYMDQASAKFEQQDQRGASKIRGC